MAAMRSAVKRQNGIPGYSPEAQRLVAQLAELGIDVPKRRQGTINPRVHISRSAQQQVTTREEEEFEEDEEAAQTDDLQEDRAQHPRSARSRRRGGQAYGNPQTERPPAKPRRQVHWLLPLGVGMLTFICLYVVIYFADLALASIGNRLSYGPDHISVYRGVIGDHDNSLHPTIFLGTMLGGSILVEELPGGDAAHAKAFTFPPLLSEAWGNMDDVIVTVSPQAPGPMPTMLVKVIGDPQFGTLLTRPIVIFTLAHTTKGYKYGGLLQQSG
jgi:hypothetical protein